MAQDEIDIKTEELRVRAVELAKRLRSQQSMIKDKKLRDAAGRDLSKYG